MTREEAIEVLRANYPDACFEQLREAVDMAIEALRNCSEKPNGSLISRQDIKYHTQLEAMGNGRYEEVEVAYKNDIESLPSAEPKIKCIAQIRIDRDDIEDLINEKVSEIVDKMAEPRTGKWVKVIDSDTLTEATWHYECDQCGAGRCENDCPNRGRMVRKNETD